MKKTKCTTIKPTNPFSKSWYKELAKTLQDAKNYPNFKIRITSNVARGLQELGYDIKGVEVV